MAPGFQKRVRDVLFKKAGKKTVEDSNTVSVAKKTTTFHSFPNLPLELREKIWKHALPGSRVVHITVDVALSEHAQHIHGHHFSSTTPVPSMLHANAEARFIALQRYQLSMASHLSGPKVYLDFEKDVIYFGEVNTEDVTGFSLASLLRDMPEEHISKIRHLGFSQELWNLKAFCNNHCMMDMESLDHLTLAMERSGIDTSKPLSLVNQKKDEHCFTSFDQDDGMYMMEEMLEWPDEVAEILDEHRLDAYNKSGLLHKLPMVEYKMLENTSKVKKTCKTKTVTLRK